MAAISFQQNIVRVVHLEVVQGGPLNTLIPNTCLQQPMSGAPLGIIHTCIIIRYYVSRSKKKLHSKSMVSFSNMGLVYGYIIIFLKFQVNVLSVKV